MYEMDEKQIDLVYVLLNARVHISVSWRSAVPSVVCDVSLTSVHDL